MKIWCLLGDQFAHVKPVQRAFGDEAEFVYDNVWDADAMLKARPDIVLCVNDYPLDIARCIEVARKNGIPSLTLQDGVLEWRCQFENPLFGAGGGAPQHQPVLSDKIGCIGHQSVRQIAAWGNAEKVELTGMPRLDDICRRKAKPRKKPGSRVLVMTAKNAGFTARQLATTIRGLREVKAELDDIPEIKTSWRVSRNVAQELQVENQLNEISSDDLTAVVEQVDAVISTPSTAVLEAMLLDRPVAMLDYHNTPRFIPTAWTICTRDHARAVVAELLNPSPTKMAFQEQSLADCVVCDGCAAERVRKLIEKMVEHSRRGQVARGTFPTDMLNRQNSYNFLSRWPLNLLYENQPVFEDADAERLQITLARAENENARLKAENAALKARSGLISRIKKVIHGLVQHSVSVTLLVQLT